MSQVTIKDSIAFVTGANRGIGKAIVEELVKNGAKKVYATARSINALDALVEAHSGKVVSLRLDVTKPEQIKAAAQQAQDTTILINNAGVANYSAIINSYDTARGRQEMEVNYFGLMNVTREFAPILKKNNGGAIVNISSVVGLIGTPMIGTYSATKAAVHSLTQSIRGELKAQGTQVLCVYPGPIDTDMAAGIEMEKDTPQNVAQAIFAAIESGADEVFPDKGSREFEQAFKADPKALEKEWGQMLPEPLKEIVRPAKSVVVAVSSTPQPTEFATPDTQSAEEGGTQQVEVEEKVAPVVVEEVAQVPQAVIEEKAQAMSEAVAEAVPEAPIEQSTQAFIEETAQGIVAALEQKSAAAQASEPIPAAVEILAEPAVEVAKVKAPEPVAKKTPIEEIIKQAGDVTIKIVVE